MPTIIALDVSLSMFRSIPHRSEHHELTYHSLALKGINQLLEHLSNTSKLEYVQLMVFSTVVEIKVDFTRDYDLVRQALKKLEPGDKLCLVSMLKSVAGILATNWGTGMQNNYSQVLVFTDGGLGFGSTALKGFLQSYAGKEKDPEYAWIATLKSAKLNFVCLGVHSDYYFARAIPLYQQLLDYTGLKGQLYMTKPPKDAADATDANDLKNSNSNANSNANSVAAAAASNISNSVAAASGTGASSTTSSSAAAAAATHSSHKSELGRTAMFVLIERVCEGNFKPYEATLKCGSYFRLECPILIWPAPVPYQQQQHSKNTTTTTPTTTTTSAAGEHGTPPPQSIAQKLEICGYLALSEIGSPASLSRHLIIPKVERGEKPTPSRRSSDKSGSGSKSTAASAGSAVGSAKSALDVNQPNYEFERLELDIRDFYTKEAKETDRTADAADSGDDASETAGANTAAAASQKSSSSSAAAATLPNEMQKESMCVLLHGALKVESLAALVLLGDNWYGFLYSYADSKKKSNLMLNILPPGRNVIPWLGDLQMLGLADDLGTGETPGTFPVKAEKRSYSQSCVVWIRHVSLQSDIQKVLRHAKKMPEKTQHFYKELNRIRRAALSIGFVELLEAMASLFDRESAHSALSANPESSFQLKHAANELRKASNLDLKVSIAPIQKFSGAEANVASAGGGIPPPPGGFVY